MKFVKMHGCGNDYIYFDCFQQQIEQPAQLAIRLSDRHFGVGGDGIVLILPSDQADVRMRMFNADGSESEMCGNAIRCVGKYCYDNGLVRKEQMTVETGAGIKTLDLFLGADGRVAKVRVNMGPPILTPANIPVDASDAFPVKVEAAGQSYDAYCVSMGNPHAVIFVENVREWDVCGIGSILEKHPVFPRKANIEFVQILSPDRARMRVWERGSGETLACGTGTCATVVACYKRGLTGNKVTVELLGGELEIEVKENVYMTGPATYVFCGEIEEE